LQPVLRCTEVSQQSDVIGHPRRFGDAGGTSAITPIVAELLHYGNRRKEPKTAVSTRSKMALIQSPRVPLTMSL